MQPLRCRVSAQRSEKEFKFEKAASRLPWWKGAACWAQAGSPGEGGEGRLSLPHVEERCGQDSGQAGQGGVGSLLALLPSLVQGSPG